MASPRTQFIHGKDLIDALAAMSASSSSTDNVAVKWLVNGDVQRIPPSMALCIARATSYEGKYNKGRVYFIREVLTRPLPVFAEEYRRGRSILCWNKPVDARTTSLWDRILGNPKAKPAYSNIVPSGTAARASL